MALFDNSLYYVLSAEIVPNDGEVYNLHVSSPKLLGGFQCSLVLDAQS
jgi:hypothetical protein